MRKMLLFLLNNVQLDMTKFPEQAQEYAAIIDDLMKECQHEYIEPEYTEGKSFCEKCGELVER
jgi:hypothetical protein